jgi:D-beta-D-heptose 7-phosphate kinase/D-beta-D-heptose 1-phosphate adenosyltransferase
VPDIFANGGDQFNDNIPEKDVCEELKIKLVDGLGEKIQSSSLLLERKT